MRGLRNYAIFLRKMHYHAVFHYVTLILYLTITTFKQEAHGYV